MIDYHKELDVACRDEKLLSKPTYDCLQELKKLFKFVVVETWRSPERAKHMLETGKSWTTKSKHLTGDAFDIMPVGGYDKKFDYEACHIAWDKIVTAHKNKEWKVTPDKIIMKDQGHFGLTRVKR